MPSERVEREITSINQKLDTLLERTEPPMPPTHTDDDAPAAPDDDDTLTLLLHEGAHLIFDREPATGQHRVRILGPSTVHRTTGHIPNTSITAIRDYFIRQAGG